MPSISFVPLGGYYAAISGFDTATVITIGGSGTGNKVQADSFDTNGPSRGNTPDHTNDHITIHTAGDYLITVSIAALSGTGGGFEAGFAVYKNDGQTLLNSIHMHRDLAGGGGDTGSISLSGIAALSLDDTIELWVWNVTNTTNLVIDDSTLSLVRVDR